MMRQITILLLLLALHTAPFSTTAQSNCNAAAFQRDDVLVVNPGQAQNVRAQPSTRAAIAATVPPGEFLTVWDGSQCADGYAWWQVSYGQQVGWTAEAPSGAVWLSKVPMKTYEAGNVRLSAPDTLVTGLSFADMSEGGGDGFSTPANRMFTLEGFPADKKGWNFIENPPGMTIYPCALIKQNSDFTPNCRVDHLITSPPETLDLMTFSTMPQWGLPGAYFDFGNGRGVRRVFYSGTGYGYSPIRPHMGYSFNALTSDGAYQIVVFLPIEVNWTPPTIPFILPTNGATGSDVFYKIYSNYLMAADKALLDLPPEAFTPRLALLDVMMRSIEITGKIELHFDQP